LRSLCETSDKIKDNFFQLQLLDNINTVTQVAAYYKLNPIASQINAFLDQPAVTNYHIYKKDNIHGKPTRADQNQ